MAAVPITLLSVFLTLDAIDRDALDYVLVIAGVFSAVVTVIPTFIGFLGLLQGRPLEEIDRNARWALYACFPIGLGGIDESRFVPANSGVLRVRKAGFTPVSGRAIMPERHVLPAPLVLLRLVAGSLGLRPRKGWRSTPSPGLAPALCRYWRQSSLLSFPLQVLHNSPLLGRSPAGSLSCELGSDG